MFVGSFVVLCQELCGVKIFTFEIKYHSVHRLQSYLWTYIFVTCIGHSKGVCWLKYISNFLHIPITLCTDDHSVHGPNIFLDDIWLILGWGDISTLQWQFLFYPYQVHCVPVRNQYIILLCISITDTRLPSMHSFSHIKFCIIMIITSLTTTQCLRNEKKWKQVYKCNSCFFETYCYLARNGVSVFSCSWKWNHKNYSLFVLSAISCPCHFLATTLIFEKLHAQNQVQTLSRRLESLFSQGNGPFLILTKWQNISTVLPALFLSNDHLEKKWVKIYFIINSSLKKKQASLVKYVREVGSKILLHKEEA